MAHALLSPSSAHQWTRCPGSIALIAQLPDSDDSTVYAAEGTAAHEQAQRAAEAVFRGETAELTTADETMKAAAVGWARMLAKQINRPTLFFWATERQFDISSITGHDGDHGTADFVALTHSGILTIADFKYGMGVEVGAERNLQLSIYALAAMEEFGMFADIGAVRLIIYQPRISPVEKVYDWNINELKAFGREIKEAAKLATSLIDKPEALENLHPGDAQCRFCRAKAVCPALQKKAQELIKAQFDIIPEPPKHLQLPETAEQLSRALPWLNAIESWCSAVREAALERLKQGDVVPGYKLVEGRKGARKWAPGAEEALRGMRISRGVLYTKSLISPTKAEAAFKQGLIGPRQWAQISGLMAQADGKPTVAPLADKRPALKLNVKDQFEVIEQE